MSLSDWLDKGWLIKHQPDRREIRELLGIADRAIVDAEVQGISPDARLSIAHNAALQLSIAALAATGYDVGREAYHYRAIKSLAFTIGADADLVDQLDTFRKKRNISDYERAGAISDQEAKEMLTLAKTLREMVNAWFKKNHPHLIK
jgi:replication fork clamp-binding protein CrfC